MTVTTTAISFFLLSIGLGICAWRFSTSFTQKHDRMVGRLLNFFLSLSALQNGILAIGLFLLEKNVFYYFLEVSYLLLICHAMLGIYLVYYIFFPRVSSFIPVSVTLSIGLVVLYLSITYPPKTGIIENSIHWGFFYPLSLGTSYLLSISIGSFAYIFFRLFLLSKKTQVKILSLFLFLTGLMGLVGVLLRFVLFAEESGFGAKFFDTNLGFIGLFFIVILLFFPLFGFYTKGFLKNEN